MKKILIASLLVAGLLSSVWAQDSELARLLTELNADQAPADTVLVEALKPTQPIADTSTVITTLNSQQVSYQLTQATSCEQLKGVFTQWAKNMPQYPIMYTMEDDMAVSSPTTAETSSAAKADSAPQGGVELGLSQTNTQVAGIDEPDLVKQDARAVYFYNSEKQQVEIYAHRARLGGGIITSTIKIPDGMYGVQLMLQSNQLVILGAYYDQNQATQTSIIDSSTVTVVALYDIRNLKTPKLTKHYTAPGYYQDVRLNGTQLTVVSSLGLNLYGLADDSATVDARTIMPYWGYNPTPTSLKNDDSLTNTTLDCGDVWYPSGTGVTDMSMTSVITIDLSKPSTAKSTLIAGNTQTVYMSADRLYLIGSQWINDTASICTPNARCLWNPGASYTQVTSLDPLNPTKPVVSRVIGYPLGQYAYHQDAAGRFYLVSQGNDINTNQSVTHIWSLDRTGKVSGALMNLEPGEKFKSSRYIGDKLYLVTFEQIDPLFVIDLSTANPKVMGELKIPGYSTYLHPYGDIAGKTYLIGLGYDVDNSHGRTVNSGVKLDLYEIDYAKNSNGNISIKQVQSNQIGGPGTESEALYNPRMFVYDEATKTVYLPLVRTVQDIVKMCPVNPDYKLVQCYDDYQNRVLFAGYKGITVTPSGITQTKVVDYQQYYRSAATAKGYEAENAYYLNSLSARVGYVNGKIWFINNWFMRTEKK